MATDNGAGPPKGSLLDSPYAQHIDPATLPRRVDNELGGTISPVTTHPAFQPPASPLTGAPDPEIIYRDIPLISTTVDWTVGGVRAALRSNQFGMFDPPAQLADAILGDDRVQATLGSRISGLFGREVRFKPADDSIAAKEVLDAWVHLWPSIASAQVMTCLSAYSILMGWVPATINWDTTGPVWCPYINFWHPRYTYYHWDLRRYVALTQDGQVGICAGNGKWLLHAPFGEYRGWVRGAIRAIAEPWLIRHWAIRDWARFSEVHGMPIKKGKCPASADETQRDAFKQSLSQLATETTLLVSEGNDGQNGYDLELVEAKDTAWESFPGLRDHCDLAITLAVLFQNLTTEVKSGGSYAASETHEDVLLGGIAYDNQSWRYTIREQVARPFAQLNFGDQRLAPYTDWDVQNRKELQHNAEQFAKFGTAVEVLARGGIKFVDSGALKRFAEERFGLKGMPDMTIGDPVAGGMGGMGGLK